LKYIVFNDKTIQSTIPYLFRGQYPGYHVWQLCNVWYKLSIVHVITRVLADKSCGKCETPSRIFDSTVSLHCSSKCAAIKIPVHSPRKMAAQPATPQKNWWDDFPAVTSAPEGWSRDQVAELVKSGAVPGRDYLVVDVRRADYGVSVG
jgi:hypothetical protein